MTIEYMAEAKNRLAKLMASENISVVYKNTATASFDLENRVLTIPIYKDVTVEVVDLMLSHEVSHAINTPWDQWKKMIEGAKSDNRSLFIDLVNIIEDARIERMIQFKFRGLAKSYVAGYKWLYENGIFKVTGDIANYGLFDRINLFFKLGFIINVPFSDDEKVLVNLVEKTKTFDDVLDAAEKIWKFAKEQKQKKKKEQKPTPGKGDDKGKGQPIEENSINKEKKEPTQAEEQNASVNGSKTDEDSDQTEKSENSTDANKAAESSTNTECKEEDSNDVGEEVKTQKDFEEEMQSKHQETGNNWSPVNRNVIIPSLKNLIGNPFYDTKLTYADWFIKNSKKVSNESRADWNKFIQSNKSIVSYMVKEFEMKKRADEYKRTSMGKTGVLDLSKMHSYKFNDDIFLKREIVKEGKNHGMILLLDLSGSMVHRVLPSAEQLITLCMFCEQAGIPFEAYGFTGAAENVEGRGKSIVGEEFVKACVDRSEGAYKVSRPIIHKLISSDMAKNEKFVAQLGLWNYAYALSKDKSVIQESTHRIWMGSTPLNSILAILPDYLANAQKRMNVQIMNLIVINDGTSDVDGIIYKTNDGNMYQQSVKITTSGHIVYRDNITKKDYIAKREYSEETSLITKTTDVFLKRIKDRMNVNLIGFFLVEKTKSIGGSIETKAKIKEAFKKQGFYLKEGTGYDKNFIIDARDYMLDDDEEIDYGLNKKKLTTQFIATSSSKIEKRIVLRKFIETISGVDNRQKTCYYTQR